MARKDEMFRVEQSVVIQCPVEEVFEYVSNFENTGEWISGIVEMRQLSEGKLQVGTKGVQMRPWLGRQEPVQFEITKYKPNQKIEFRVDEGFIAPFVVAELFEPIDLGTLVTFTAQGTPRGLVKLSWPIASRLYARQVEADLSCLKTLLESQAPRKVFAKDWRG